jgi:secreted PhoX family phosphatase
MVTKETFMNNMEDGDSCNRSSNEHFQQVLNTRMSRRGLIRKGLATAAFLSLGGVDALLRAVPASAQVHNQPLLGFQGVPVSDLDTVVVPDGYTAEVLIAWGDPVSSSPAFKQDASNSASDQARQWGMHNDGVVYFPIIGSQRGLLVQNNEYTDDGLLFTDGIANWNPEKTNKSLNAHGVSIIEITKRSGFPWDRRRRHGRWDVVRPSPFARRITGMTPIEIGGPAAGDARLRTIADPAGTRVLGTLNNCAMGFTPWGTYLACEENFNGYFRKNGPPTNFEKRYGITAAASGISGTRPTCGFKSMPNRMSRTASAGWWRSIRSGRIRLP